MRLLVTADLHYNHPKSRALANDQIHEMNRTGGDVLLVVGDTASTDRDYLEQCLSRFQFPGPKLFVPGNHELWSLAGDTDVIFQAELPRRVRDLGWHWLQGEPFRMGSIGFVGSVGWYDYSFAPNDLGIPKRFYENKISPGAAKRFSEFSHLFDNSSDISSHAMEVVARWNDGKFVRLHRSDETFLAELLDNLRAQLEALRDCSRVIAAIHHLPFAELLPPPNKPQWDFAKTFLGSPRIGELLLSHANVTNVFCGHSHFAAEARIGNIHAENIGSGYRSKFFKQLTL